MDPDDDETRAEPGRPRDRPLPESPEYVIDDPRVADIDSSISSAMDVEGVVDGRQLPHPYATRTRSHDVTEDGIDGSMMTRARGTPPKMGW